ncbi:hypothetical protein JHK84_029509 [Glycine max]|nr:hypothetical protein JHK84_029509 [Glycine max]
MEAKKEYEVDHLSTPTGTSFSQLLFGDDDDDVDESALGLAVDQSYSYNYNNLTRSPLFSIHKAPQMLCFGNHQNEEGDVLLPETNLTPQKSVITSSDSSSASASSCNHTNTAFNSLPKSNNVSHSSLQKKRQEGVAKVGVGSQRQTKKNKAENPTSTGHAKTDTASVLHEAMGYIRFLHDQVQVLCSPYLQSLPSSYHQNQHGGGGNNEEEVNKDLRSKGLCLIPVGCTVHVAGSNGADFWSSAAIGNNVSFTISQAVKRNQDQ